MKPIKREPVNGIFHLRFQNQYDMNSTLLRIQEFSDSVKFKGKTFSLEEYMDWYAHKYGKFDYLETVFGFNIPGVNLEPFYDGRFDPLSKKELGILEIFQKERDNLEDFLIITTFREQELSHELAHGLFYLDKNYSNEVREIVRQINPRTRKRINTKLKSLDYHPSIWADETNAYSVERRRASWVPRFPQRAQLKELFKEYSEIYKKGK